jgi:PAS domain S-box-containing protein
LRLRLDSLSLRLGALFVVLLLTAALAVGYHFDRGRAEAMEHREREHLKLHATRAADYLSRQVDRLRRDTLFLTGTPPVQGLRRSLAAGGTDPVDGSTDTQWRGRLQQIFLTFAQTRPEYFQLRLIGAAEQGRELVRVERYEGELRVVAPAQLQRKASRYYFQQAARLPTGELYLSRIDLNREHGRIEPEHISTLRAATPVRGPGGDLFGVVVVNMDMRLLFAYLQELLGESELLFVVDEDGNFVHHPDREKTFGFELGRSIKVAEVLGGQAARIGDLEPEVGGFLDLGEEGGRATAFVVTRSLDGGKTSRSLTLILTKPTELIAHQAGLMRRDSLAVMGALLLGGVSIALFMVRHLTGSLRQVTLAAEAIARGDYEKPLPAVTGNEVGVLVSAFRRMAEEVSSRERARAELNRNLERLVDERTSDLERSRAELVRQQALQKLVLEGINDGVVVADTRGRFLLWNCKASAIMGSGPEDVDPRTWSEHYGVYRSEDGELVPTEELPLTRAIRGKSTDDVQVFVRKGESGGRWISLVGRPLQDQDGRLEGGVVTLTDITERKRLQSRLAVHQSKLARVGRLALRGEIAAMVSHQLSQPLAAISNYSGAAIQLQRAGRLDQERSAEILGHVNRLAERGGRALDNLRSLARRREVSPTGVDLSVAASSCIDVVADRLTRDGIQLECDLAEDLPVLDGDPMELEQLLMHLIVNALDALEHQPRDRRHLRICTTLEQAPRRVLAEVGDSGRGVFPELQDRLFEPWVTDKPGGLGIGLSIVRTLVENYGGRVWMQPGDPFGAVFRVEFPVGGEGRS